MIPFADFTYFGLLLIYVLLPTLVLGLFGRANARWALLVTGVMLAIQFSVNLEVRPHFYVREIWIVLAYAVWQWAIAAALLRGKSRGAFYTAFALSLLPLLIAKFIPSLWPRTSFGFFGISYVSFRALDVIFSIRDRVVTSVPPLTYAGFLFLFPTVSSGPIDRFRRFSQDWQRRRTREEFLIDLDSAVERIFRGFLYKFIIAALIQRRWIEGVEHGPGLQVLSYMYAYTFYLFFDFAGYSAFAVGFSHLLGIRTPENFKRPFLSPNIREFWNRWHISLSFWFRDHVYMRFLLTAAKGKWFKGKHTASYFGLFLTFGLMGIWHGTEWHFILYGCYHATLLCGYDAFARWNKTAQWFGAGPAWRTLNIFLTFHAVAFGLLIFSGRFSARTLPAYEETAEVVTCKEIGGYAWDRDNPNQPVTVAIYVDNVLVSRVAADQPRPDLLARGFGNGLHGFHAWLPLRIRDGAEHTIYATVTNGGTERRLKGTPITVTCPRDEVPALAPAGNPVPTPPVPAVP